MPQPLPTPPEESPGFQPDLRQSLVEICGDNKLVFFDDLDDCIVGLATVHGSVPRVAYNVDAILASLRRDGLSEDQAMEVYDDTIASTYRGPYTPALILSAPGKELEVAG